MIISERHQTARKSYADPYDQLSYHDDAKCSCVQRLPSLCHDLGCQHVSSYHWLVITLDTKFQPSPYH